MDYLKQVFFLFIISIISENKVATIMTGTVFTILFLVS